MVARDRGNVMISLSDKRLLSMDEFAMYTSMGMNKTRDLAELSGALFKAGDSWLTGLSLTAGVMNTTKHKIRRIPLCAEGRIGEQEHEQTEKEICAQELGIEGRNVYGCFWQLQSGHFCKHL